MRNFCLMVARFCLAAWVGAAALFVVTSVSEQVSTEIGSETKNLLAALRFPWYYRFAFVLVGLGFLTGILGIDRVRQRGRWLTTATLLMLSLVVTAVDYWVIYSPLHESVSNPSGVRDARFIELHRWSERINTVHVTLAALAAVIVCWPEKQSREPLTTHHSPLTPQP